LAGGKHNLPAGGEGNPPPGGGDGAPLGAGENPLPGEGGSQKAGTGDCVPPGGGNGAPAGAGGSLPTGAGDGAPQGAEGILTAGDGVLSGAGAHAGRLSRLRELMASRGLCAYVVSDADPHASEYPAAHWRARSWLSGFDGSNGVFAVTAQKAALWTDGRYYIQAAAQLAGAGAGAELMKLGEPRTPSLAQWLLENVGRGGAVGLNGRAFSCAGHDELAGALARGGARVEAGEDLVGRAWDEEGGRPQLPGAPLFLHELRFAGVAARDKIAAVRGEMAKLGATHALIAGLEDAAWLFNVRGGDIPRLPVAYAYALVSGERAELYADLAKAPAGVRAALEGEGVSVREYGEFEGALRALGAGTRLCYDPRRLSVWLLGKVGKGAEAMPAPEPTKKLKAAKSNAEIANYRGCQLRDGAAMVRFLIWLEGAAKSGGLREGDIPGKLRELRAAMPNSMGESFTTIAGFGPNGAMMHYAPKEGGGARISGDGLLVVDSGGQYLDGTTDITRTAVIGRATAEQRHDFTMALKAHIALASARFLYGAPGGHLDAIARKAMWDEAMDYKSGTGHGVGYFLSVHESPPSISMRSPDMQERLEENMIVSIEPGVYREGKHGVRIENLARVAADIENEFGRFMRFEIMSFCPISLDGVDAGMLDAKERAWLNGYHGDVLKKLSPLLGEAERAWLRLNTRPI
jgi:Xaa-Pro aminopeptidase